MNRKQKLLLAKALILIGAIFLLLFFALKEQFNQAIIINTSDSFMKSEFFDPHLYKFIMAVIACSIAMVLSGILIILFTHRWKDPPKIIDDIIDDPEVLLALLRKDKSRTKKKQRRIFSRNRTDTL